MKVIIAGSRDLDDINLVAHAVEESGYHVTEVVSGTARGVDQKGEQWAASWGIPIKRFPADWERLGKRAGYLRNAAMSKYADALIAIWDGTSRGTKHMIDPAVKEGLHVFVYETRRV